MIRSKGFAYVAVADLLVRSGYQMGKTPLLPIFAASLGAGDVFLGMIVSVSTLTGLVLKPFVGILSDRWGRRAWLLLGTAFFAGVPFVYRLVGTPEQLFAVRMIHGMATAIYGPVTLAYVAELSPAGRAERIGWFSMARSAGYIVGPAAAGWMLLSMDPVSVFTAVGLLSCLAFVPVALLPEGGRRACRRAAPLLAESIRALWSGARTPAVWLAGGLDAQTYVAVYAAKTFLPLHAVLSGVSPAAVGAVFAIQEAVHVILNPLGGRVGDRLGYLATAALGLAALGVALTLIAVAESGTALLGLAVLVGTAQALVLPATLALASSRGPEGDLGLRMGLVGTLRNTGKVAGPALAGVLIFWLDFELTFGLLGVALIGGAAVLGTSAHRSGSRAALGIKLPERG